MSKLFEHQSRRSFLVGSAATLGAFAVTSYLPKTASAVSPDGLVDLSILAKGDRLTVEWQGTPIFIARRTEAEIAEARLADFAFLRSPKADVNRVQNEEFLIVVGRCTGSGCLLEGQSLADNRGNYGGWYNPTTGAHYDTSGRIRSGQASANLVVPDYEFVSEKLIKLKPIKAHSAFWV